MKTALMLIYDLFSLPLIAEWNQFAWVPKERNVKIGENEKKKKENEINSFFIRTNINNFAKRKAIFILRCHTKQAEIEKRLEESEIWCK